MQVRSILMYSHSFSHPNADCGTLQAAEHIDRCTCRHSEQTPQRSRDDETPDVRVNTAQNIDHNVNSYHDTSPADRLAVTDVAVDTIQSGTRQRKRHRFGLILRKMLPGAGVLAGLAVLAERVWEVVENVN